MLARATNRTERLRHQGLPLPHHGHVCSKGGVTGVLQSSAPKSEAKSLQQLPGRKLSSSSSRSLTTCGVLPQRSGQSRQPTNQLITFPQISAIWASTNRPIRTLRQFKPLSRSVIVESPVRLDDFHGDPHFVLRDLEQAHPNDERQIE